MLLLLHCRHHQVDTLVDEVFAQVDVDRNGSISLEEWRAAWESAAACPNTKGRPARLHRAPCALGSLAPRQPYNWAA